MSKRVNVLLVVLLIVSSLMVVKAASASDSIPKPSVPEFTLKFMDSSYDVPTSTSIDPYTGKTVTNAGYHVENKSIEFTIKNQPHHSSGDLYYNVRVKGHFAENWTYIYGNEYSPRMSNSDYTIIVFSSFEGGAFRGFNDGELYAPSGGEVDFQVEAFVGYYVHTSEPPSQFTFPWIFTTLESGWSNTQTLKIPTSSQTPDQTTEPTPNQTTESTSDSQTLQIAAIIGTVTAIVVVSLGLLVYFKKRKR